MSSQMLTANEVLGARVFTADEIDNVEDGDGSSDGSKYVELKTRRLESQKMSKSQKLAKSKKQSKSENLPNFNTTKADPSFLTSETRAAFNCLRLAFTEASILQYFDPECHIRIETNASDYAIGGMLSQLASGTRPDRVVTKTNLSQWHPVAFFFRKMIPAETWYETYDSKLLAIVEVFKMCHHYLKGCKHKILVLTDHNNLCYFIDTKSLSFRQVCWAQELSQYYFQIDYCQGKANTAADALSRFPQRSQDEKMSFELKMAKSFTVCRIH